MQFLTEILATTLVSGALIAALGYSLRATIGEWMVGAVKQKYAKEIENHKADLKAVGDTSLERLRFQLQVEAAMHQTRFSGQYEKAAAAIVGIHSRLDEVFLAVADYTKIFEPANGASKEDRRNIFNGTIKELRAFYRTNRIYLPSEIAERVKHLEEQLFDTANKFSMKVEHGRDEDESTKEWTATYKRLKDEILPLLQDLENQFRAMLGIEDIFPH